MENSEQSQEDNGEEYWRGLYMDIRQDLMKIMGVDSPIIVDSLVFSPISRENRVWTWREKALELEKIRDGYVLDRYEYWRYN